MLIQDRLGAQFGVHVCERAQLFDFMLLLLLNIAPIKPALDRRLTGETRQIQTVIVFR